MALSPLVRFSAFNEAANAGKCQATNPPTILTQPQSQTVAVGSAAILNVNASGSSPLSYQWRFNETNLVGASSATLTIDKPPGGE